MVAQVAGDFRARRDGAVETDFSRDVARGVGWGVVMVRDRGRERMQVGEWRWSACVRRMQEVFERVCGLVVIVWSGGGARVRDQTHGWIGQR